MPTVHALLTSQTSAEAIPETLVSLGVVALRQAAYAGRERQKVKRDREVWIEKLPTEPGGPGFQGVTRHPYLLHVYQRGNAGARGRGEELLETVEEYLQVIEDHFQASCPYKTAIPGMVHAEAAVEEVDEEPEETMKLEGTVRVTFTVAA